MIPCQRDMFDIPENIAYLNCAYTSPLLKVAQEAGRAAVQAKANPWTITSGDFFSSAETARELFAQLVACNQDDVALVPAVSYGIALAARNLPVERDQAIVVLQDQFPSNVYAWMRMAQEKNAVVKTVKRPPDSDWTPAVLEAIDSDTAIVAVQNCHWTDGTLLDLVKIGEKCRAVQAALVIDGIQSIGAMPFSIDRVQPDFLVAASHKWLLVWLPHHTNGCWVLTVSGFVMLHQNGMPESPWKKTGLTVQAPRIFPAWLTIASHTRPAQDDMTRAKPAASFWRRSLRPGSGKYWNGVSKIFQLRCKAKPMRSPTVLST